MADISTSRLNRAPRQPYRHCWIMFLTMMMACQKQSSVETQTKNSDQKSPLSTIESKTPSNGATGSSKGSETSARFQFHELPTDHGLDFTRFDDIRGMNRIQEGPGGGVALFDYDLDGLLDLFYPQGCRLPRREKTQEFSNAMFRNVDVSGPRFQNITASAGLRSFGYHTGATVGDIDEDGFPDLYVTAYGRSSLWKNNGDGTFQEVGESTRTVVDTWSTSAAFVDLNGDGLLDLFVAGYVDATDDPPKICREPASPTGTKQCSPTLFSAVDDVCLINNGSGTFTDVTLAASITGRDGKGLGVVACDVNGDRRPDLFVANDGTPCFLYVNVGNQDHLSGETKVPTFEERAAEFGVALNGDGHATAAMGIAHGDENRDGWIDLFVTNFYLETNSLFRNLQGTGFADASFASRLGPPSRSTLAFGTEFLDIDHDGWLDLFVATGHIEDRSWTGLEPYKMQPHLFRNDGHGHYRDLAADSGPYFQSQWVGRGTAIGDVDRDGDLDLVVAHQIDPSKLLLNDTPRPRSSVIIKPVGHSLSPRSGIGVRVVATGIAPVSMQELAGGGSFQSASALELHLGLSQRESFEMLELTWPDGHIDRCPDVTEGYYVARQGRGLIRINVHH